mmetsp:Transcript_120208/g.212515  ORF Transcript_120208/g.212515 Transcript_120208/m.212515 type:complete len:214 (+) Transcript_120208:109-750(+)
MRHFREWHCLRRSMGGLDGLEDIAARQVDRWIVPSGHENHGALHRACQSSRRSTECFLQAKRRMGQNTAHNGLGACRCMATKPASPAIPCHAHLLTFQMLQNRFHSDPQLVPGHRLDPLDEVVHPCGNVEVRWETIPVCAPLQRVQQLRHHHICAQRGCNEVSNDPGAATVPAPDIRHHDDGYCCLCITCSIQLHAVQVNFLARRPAVRCQVR